MKNRNHPVTKKRFDNPIVSYMRKAWKNQTGCFNYNCRYRNVKVRGEWRKLYMGGKGKAGQMLRRTSLLMAGKSV